MRGPAPSKPAFRARTAPQDASLKHSNDNHDQTAAGVQGTHACQVSVSEIDCRVQSRGCVRPRPHDPCGVGDGGGPIRVPRHLSNLR
jgi:hypothetical protein